MGAGRAKATNLRIRHSFTGQSIYLGGQTRVILDGFQPDWMRVAIPANVVSFKGAAQKVVKNRVLKIPMPANDNLAPLDP
ncbi:hypothetical protein AB2B41_01895 [Marimonas sp. MJW-29]|uniref:Uncharacterized protein n=1 Tax=Sulfitobacter sediminis TaxID=3234186 RepID=A0ABV3RHJ4_9RHOB